MLLEYTQGSLLWSWFYGYAGLHGMALCMLTAMVAVFFTKWTPLTSCIKIVVSAGMLISIPLGFSQMGFDMQISNDEVAANLSFWGSVITIAVGVPYLFQQNLKVASNGVYKYIDATIRNEKTMAMENPVVNSKSRDTMVKEPDVTAVIDVPVESTQGNEHISDLAHTKTMTIGRSPENDVVINDPTVSRYHARVTFDGTKYQVEDLGSKSGTLLDGRKLKSGEASTGDTMELGNTEIKLDGTGKYGDIFPQTQVLTEKTSLSPKTDTSDGNTVQTRVINKPVGKITWLTVTAGPAAGNSYQLNEGVNVIGRKANDGFSVNDSYMSRMHAMVRNVKGIAYLNDLGSTGGTRVNNKRIDSQDVEPNSVIRVGQTHLKMVEADDPRQFAPVTLSGKTVQDLQGQRVGVLVVTSGVDVGKSFVITEGDNMIGRGAGVTINLEDDTVSRQHAVIRCKNGKVSLFDVGSESGTSLDGKLLGNQPLSNGDVISLGRSEFTVISSVKEAIAF